MTISISIVQKITLDTPALPTEPTDAIISRAILQALDANLITPDVEIVGYEISLTPLDLYLCHDSTHWDRLRADLAEGAGEFNLGNYLDQIPPAPPAKALIIPIQEIDEEKENVHTRTQYRTA